MKSYRLLVAGIAVAIASTVAVYAAGNYSTYPIVGGSSFCASTVGVNGQAGNTGQGGGAAGTNGAYCAQTVPAGPSTLTGSEVIPMDTGLANGAPPQTVVMPSTLIGNGYGGTTIATTTGTTASVVVANGISTYIYAGNSTATYTAFTLPSAPIQNQKLCLVNAGSGVLTLSAVNAASGQSLVGTTPTSLPVATAVGTAGTVTLSSNCWLYNVSNTTWYRVL